MADVLFDAGTSGDTITPANSNVTSVGGNTSGNTATLSPLAAWHGGLGGLFRTVAGGNVAGCFFTRIYDEGDDDQQTLSGIVLLPSSAPTSDFTMGSWRDPANATILRFFYRQSDGGLYISDQGDTYTLIAPAGSYFWNTKYRLTVTADVGTATTNGVFAAKLRKQADQTQVGSTAAKTNANLGTAAFHRFVGGIIGNNLGYQVGWDDVQLYSGRVDELADWTPPANVPPVVYAGADQTVLVGTSTTRTGTATDADGTIASQQWTCTSYPGGLSSAPTFPAGATFTYGYPVPGTYAFAFTATDNDGASATDSVTVVAVAASAPTATVNQTAGPGLIDARASTSAAGGALSYSISPAGPTPIAAGVWYQAPISVPQTFTITVTEAGSGQTATATTTVAPGTALAPYTGGLLVLDLPTPGDVADKDQWAMDLNTEIGKIVAKLLDIQAYLANPPADFEQGTATLTRSGAQLQVNGSPVRLSGANAYWLGLDDNAGGGQYGTFPSKATITAAITGMREMGVNLVRAHTIGISAGTPNSFETAPGTFVDANLDAADWAIYQAKLAGIYLMVPLTDNWNYYHGGKWNFVHWAYGQNSTGITDTPGTTKDDVNERIFFANTAPGLRVRALFKDYISHWLNHVNPYTGLAYKDDPTLAIIETGNEIYYAAQTGSNEWTQDIASYVKSIAPSKLVADGSAADRVAVTTEPGLTAAAVDIVGAHYYPQTQSGAYPPVPFGASGTGYPAGTALQQLAADATAAANAGKAFIVGEYPWTRSDIAAWYAAIENTAAIDADLFWAMIGGTETHGGAYGSDDYPVHRPYLGASESANAPALAHHINTITGLPLSNGAG